MKKIGTIENGRVLRFSLHMRIQHIVLMVSLIALAVTGFALKYNDSVLGRFLLTIEGGMTFRGMIHRFFAVILVLDIIYHLWYTVFTDEGHRELMLLKPSRKDVTEFFAVMRYTLTGRGSKPEFDKYTYREKIQYWGVVVGVSIMVITGFLLWFETASMTVMPKWIFDITGIVHGAEGIILFIILFLWHAYNVHIGGKQFFNTSFISGWEDLDYLKKERPLEYKRYTGGGEGV